MSKTSRKAKRRPASANKAKGRSAVKAKGRRAVKAKGVKAKGVKAKGRRAIKAKGRRAIKAKGRTAIPALNNVWVVSSIPFHNQPFERQFLSGLSNNFTGQYNWSDNLGYDMQALQTAVQQAGQDNQTLVVAVGGLVSGQAAWAVNTVPFIALTGSTDNFPNAPSGSFLGGVCLDSSKHDSDRVTHLMKKLKITADQVCLLYNSNAPMAINEQQQFAYSVPADIDPNNVNNPTPIFTAAFNNIAQLRDPNGQPVDIQAIVVSADPFFTQAKDSLKAVANGSNYYMTYPLKEYKSGAVAPKHGHSTIYAPIDDLSAVYKMLGQKAGDIIISRKSVTWYHEGLGNPVDQ